MKRMKVGDGWVNMDHIVTVERRDGIQFARLLSGTTVGLAGVYPLVYELFQVSKDAWVNPDHVSIVEIGYNRGAAYQAIQAKEYTNKVEDYMQVRVETVLGRNHEVWADLYGLDEVDNLAGLLDAGTNYE